MLILLAGIFRQIYSPFVASQHSAQHSYAERVTVVGFVRPSVCPSHCVTRTDQEMR